MMVAKRFSIAIGITVSLWLTAVFCGTAAGQTTIHVPGDIPSISQAISQAQNGDTVLVAPGTYFDNIFFQGKAITVASTDGPAVTILDARNISSVALFSNGEGPQSILKGFTITHGASASSGAGISISNSSPTIDGNIITANQGCEGIGIEADNSSAVIKNNVITNNVPAGCTGTGGGGIEISGPGNAQILNNVITGNQVWGNGGGIEVNLNNVTTSLNNVIISGNSIQNNFANLRGGGINIEDRSPVNIIGNLVTGNSAGVGGGIALVSDQGNQSLFVNNTVVANTGFGLGQQVWLNGSNDGTQFVNNVIVDFTGNGAISCLDVSPAPSFVSNDVISTQPGPPSQTVPPITGFACTDVTGTNGNIQQDPQFVNPAGNDYHLQASSPAIDAGSNSAPSLPDKDLDGNARIGPGNASTCVGSVDMGAYEFALSSSGSGFLSPFNLDFGTVAVGSSSGQQTFSVYVQGCVQVASITTSGDFSQTNNCGHALSGSSCIIQVTFAPTTGGLRTGSLKADFGSSATSVSANLTGQGLVVAASANPTSLAFGNQVIGSASPPQFVTILGGGQPIQISSVSITGDYTQTNSCFGPPIAPPGCNVSVSFSPTAIGSRPGSMVINTTQGSFTITISGTGINPQGTLSPLNLTFPNQLVNTSSSPQAVTLTNIGVGPLQITGSVSDGDFALSSNCGATLDQNASCTINVTFKPTVAGPRSGFFSLFTNNGMPSASLSGTGVVPVAAVSPAALTFANQLLNSTSSAQTVTLSNTGGAPLHITSITASGDFAETNGCGAALDPGATCSVNVTFTPAALGSRTGSLAIASDGGSPTVSLSGTGVAPLAAVTPATLTFADQLLNTSSTPQTITLSNTGTAALQISSIAVSGNYLQTNNCGVSLDPGASCSISVSFAPALLGQRPGTLTVTSNGGPASVSLTGNGIAAIPTLSPSSLTFANQLVGTTSAAQVATLTNTGNIVLNISSISASTGFGQTNSCGASLAPGASCSINVTFTPFAAQTVPGNLSFSTDGLGGARTVALSGQGIAPVASLDPASLTFASQALNTTSAAQTVSLSNTGSAAMQLTSISITSTSGSGTNGFAQTNNCGSSLSPGASCAISVTFTPDTLGGRGAFLTVNSNAPSAVANLSGTGIAAIATLVPQSLTFGNQLVQTASPAQTVTLTNTGNVALTFSAISVTGDFSQTNNCGSSLAAGGSCTINVTFTPSATGGRSGSLTLSSNSGTTASPVTLSGSGVAPAAALSPASLSFGNQLVNSPSAAQSVTLTNTGAAALTINSIGVTGDFSQTSNCGSSLSAGGSCTINVTFIPTARLSRVGSLAIQSNSTPPVPGVALSGVGIAPVPVFSPGGISFGTQRVGTSSAAQVLTFANNGDAALSANGFSIIGSSEFTQTNNCPSSLAPGQNCSMLVVFTPSSRGAKAATISVNTQPPFTTSAALSGTGIAPAATLTPSVDFGFQDLHSSATQNATLSNVGELVLSISSINISGGGYSQSHTCGNSLAAGSSCTIQVKFNANALGTITGSLTVTDNDPAGGTQVAALSGTGVDFAVSSSPTSATVAAGQTATFPISVAPLGGDFPNGVSLTCGGLPAGTTCSFSPNPVVPGSSSAVSVLNLTTSAGQNGTQKTPTGSHGISISGVSGGLKHNLSLTLVVN